ncbi:MAG TPA: isoprenylcysteine carboxylmethyltransferase family protein [Piscirickettsiaceae bacterium]|nr:isoprenylcysteine carboxylmethyltransferase family protein [Piscirickettsiaceae bacterium]HIQ40584.1 isoprenylcysteine carboxylmethyltransferase family protein [Sulfurivirga caldicuralii]
MVKYPLLSHALVAVQFGAMGALLLTGPLFATHPAGIAAQVSAVFVGLWALITLRRFNIVPDPRQDCTLVCHGPYRWIRHPMYLSILLFFTPLVVETPTLWRGILLAILTVDLIIKLLYEETLLCRQLEGYAAYCTRSHRLIPFIW